MRVRDLMRRLPRHATPHETLDRAGRTMAEAGVGVLPVIDGEGRVVAMLTDRDVCCALVRHDLRPSEVVVQAVASAPAVTCSADDDLPTALATLRAYAVRRLPVVDAGGRLEGMLSLDEIVLAVHKLVHEEGLGPLQAQLLDTLQAIVRPAAVLAPAPKHPVAAL
jgi:CBS domain-containing protein